MKDEIMKLVGTVKGTMPDVITELKTIATATEIPEDEIIEEWYSLVNDDILSKFPEEKKIVLATRRLRAKYAGILMSQGKEYIVQVLDKTSVISGKNKKTGEEYRYGTIWGIAQLVEDDNDTIAVCRLSVGGNTLDKYKDIQIGKTYKAKLGGSYRDDIFNLRTDDATRFEEADSIIEDNIMDFFTDKFKTLTVSEFLNEASFAFSTSPYDMKILYGDVANSFVATSATGRDYGKYILVDDSINFGDGGANIFVDPEQVRFATGSSIYAIGKVTKGKNGMVMNAYIIVPDIAIERYKIEDDDTPTTLEHRLDL